MRTHTLLHKVTSLAVCFGVLLSGPVMAGGSGIIKDVELSQEGVLYGQIYSSQGQVVPNAVVQLRYQGAAVAAARSNTQGQFAISGVRGGAHEVVVGPLRSPVRLWAVGAAPKSATKGIVVAIDETVVRGQDVYCEPGDACAPTSGFGMLDVITLATVGAAVGALVVAIDNNNKLDDLEAALPASP
ncbi:MAG: carboxypeptidase-like regulatory domain-containing protein [Fuerstiella sp.]